MQNNYSNIGAVRGDCRTAGGMDREIVYAGFWVRLAAYTIDSFIVFAGLLIVRLFLLGVSSLTEGTPLGGNILFHYTLKDILLYGVQVFYFILCTYHAGTTPGKRVMNLRVVSAVEEEKLSFLNVLYRETVGRFLSGLVLCIGYILIGIDKEKRGLHDMLCDTRVIYGRRIKVYPVYQVPPVFSGAGTPPAQKVYPPNMTGPGRPPMQQGSGVPPVQQGSGIPPVPPMQQGPGMSPAQNGYPQNMSGAGTGIFDRPFQNSMPQTSEVPSMPVGGYRMVTPEKDRPKPVEGQPEEDHPKPVEGQPEEDYPKPVEGQPEGKYPEPADVQEERDS